MMKQATYQWNVEPRIVTYTNPLRIDENTELFEMMCNYPHFCASDTLMQGMTRKYGFDSFVLMDSVEKLVVALFDGKIGTPQFELQIYMDVSECIDKMPDNIWGRGISLKQAFRHNIGYIIDAFKTLILLEYEPEKDVTSYTEEQNLFFKYIYSLLQDKYKQIINAVKNRVLSKNFEKILEGVFIDRVRHETGLEESIKTVDDLIYFLQKQIDVKKTDNSGKIIWEEDYLRSCNNYLMNSFHTFDAVVIHGVLRFTPEIMLAIQLLDSIGKKVIFTFNYAENYKEIYSIWERAYAWTGKKIDGDFKLNIMDGRQVGINMADVLSGKRIMADSMSALITYNNITEYTDGHIKKVFEMSQSEVKKNSEKDEVSSSRILANMSTQFYATCPDKANEILRNYFPEQFSEKPFMAYPIGRFLSGLFSLWDFEKGKMKIDFDILKECSVVMIGHSNRMMPSILDDAKLYFSDIEYKDEFDKRCDYLLEMISRIVKNNNIEFLKYFSFYNLTANGVDDLKLFVNNLYGICIKLFENNKHSIKLRDYFKMVMGIVKDEDLVNADISQKEYELIETLYESLSRDSDDETAAGNIADVENALNFYLSTKRKKSGSDWIVRGFDQLDGAPFLSALHSSKYDFGMLSMKNMTAVNSQELPWPLDERVFANGIANEIFLQQQRLNLKEYGNYLKFYLFYGVFFSKAEISFSYIQEENDETQRPYFVLELLKLNKKNKPKFDGAKIKYDVKQELRSNSEEIVIPENRRENDIFSVCRYKYFLSSIVDKHISYTSNFHILYLIKIELRRRVQDRVKKGENVQRVVSDEIVLIRDAFPYIDAPTISDLRAYGLAVPNGNQDALYVQRKRDFLYAGYTEDGKKYMKFDKTAEDIESYFDDPLIYPITEDFPKDDICKQCNFINICMKKYFEKVVNV